MYWGKGGCIREKCLYSGQIRFFGQSGFFSDKSCCTRAKLVLFGRKWLYSGKVVVFGQEWLYSGKLLYSGKRGYIREKVVVIGQGDCIRAKLVVFGQK